MAFTAARKCRVIKVTTTNSNIIGKMFIVNNSEFKNTQIVNHKDGLNHSWRLCDGDVFVYKKGVWRDLATGDIVQSE